MTQHGGLAPFESPDGKYVYYAKGLVNPSLWCVPVEGGEESLVLDRVGSWAVWAVVDDGIYFEDGDGQSGEVIEFFSFATRRVTKVAAIAKPSGLGLAVSPDERWLVCLQNEEGSSKVMLGEQLSLKQGERRDRHDGNRTKSARLNLSYTQVALAAHLATPPFGFSVRTGLGPTGRAFISSRSNIMKRNLRFTLRIAAAVFLTLVPAELLAHHSGDPKLDRAIEKANSEFIVAMRTGDAATIAAPYTNDASFIQIDGACIQGRAEIEKMYRDRFARSGLARSTKINSKKLVVDGDLAYESGYGEIGLLKDGKLSINGGRFLTVWQRQANGDWKILRNVVLP